MNAIAFDCRESSPNGEPEGLAVLGHAQFAMLDLGQQRNVTRQDADFTFNRRDHDRVDRVGVNPRFRSDDFEGERHGLK